MKKNCFGIISPIVFLISLSFILVFRAVPSGKLWKNYIVMYVSSSSDDSSIQNAFTQNGIEDAVSLSGQYLPVIFSENSLEVSMFRINFDKPEYSYYLRRNAFFFDKSQNFRLYYIPSSQKAKLQNCIKFLDNIGIQCGVDSESSYPWILPLVAILLALVVAFFSKNKAVFLFSLVIPVSYIYANPFYPCALAYCLIVLCLFYISNVWKRKGAVEYLLGNYCIPAMACTAFLSSISCSVLSGVMFVIMAAGVFAALYMFNFIQEYFQAKSVNSFVPVFIRPAKLVPLFSGRSRTSLYAATAASVIFIALYALSTSSSFDSHFSKIQLPGDSSVRSQNLPQLEEYYKWMWNVKTYPYRSLNSSNKIESLAEFPRYKKENVRISESSDIFEYNKNFKEEVFNQIDLLPFNSIEKVIKSEGSGFNAGYISSNQNHINLFGIIMMFICLFILLFIYIYTIISKKRINK